MQFWGTFWLLYYKFLITKDYSKPLLKEDKESKWWKQLSGFIFSFHLHITWYGVWLLYTLQCGRAGLWTMKLMNDSDENGRSRIHVSSVCWKSYDFIHNSLIYSVNTYWVSILSKVVSFVCRVNNTESNRHGPWPYGTYVNRGTQWWTNRSHISYQVALSAQVKSKKGCMMRKSKGVWVLVGTQ